MTDIYKTETGTDITYTINEVGYSIVCVVNKTTDNTLDYTLDIVLNEDHESPYDDWQTFCSKIENGNNIIE